MRSERRARPGLVLPSMLSICSAYIPVFRLVGEALRARLPPGGGRYEPVSGGGSGGC